MIRDFNQFVGTIKARESEEISTVGGRSSFRVTVVDGALIYHPKSTQKPRRQQFKDVRRVFESYLETRSLSPRDYSEMTMNASYVLALISAYFGDSGGKTRTHESNDDESIEGYFRETRFLRRVRNRTLVEKRKKLDNFTCRACGFKFNSDNETVVECHHLIPISESGEVVTKIEDLITLCPTCHRIAHLRTPPYGLPEIVRKRRDA